jgi:hypothetical protein
MVANRWPTARYQPADALYKPSSTEEEEVGERVIKKNRGGREERNPKHKDTSCIFEYFWNPIPKTSFPSPTLA